MDSVRLYNIEIYAHHGVLPQERELGQRFELDIELFADLTAAAQQDDLAQTLDYDAVYHAACSAFTARNCQLLEHAAWQVMAALFDQFSAQQITVRVRKPAAPIDGILDGVEVELTRSREQLAGG